MKHTALLLLTLPALAAASSTHSALEGEFFTVVNGYRSGQGLPALRWDDRIAAAARRHSEEIATGRVAFSHEGFKSRIAGLQAMLAVGTAAENLVAQNPGPRAAMLAVNRLALSEGHRKNMLGAFTATGVGIAADRDGTLIVTQIFIEEETLVVSPPPPVNLQSLRDRAYALAARFAESIRAEYGKGK